ncbi:MAG: glycogen synthase [Candidatus Cloacimonetes bacterium]|nr:glycogen synthase [Candidatus Cloacimonadota bacterium]
MKVLMVVPELAPFYKYSRLGLGENLRSLLFHLPKSAVAIMPYYRDIEIPTCRQVDTLPELGLEVCETLFPASQRRVLMIRPASDGAFDPFIAGKASLEQVALFSRGVAAWVQRNPGWDVAHCHHWQTGLIPLLLRNLDHPVPSLFTFYDLEPQMSLFADDFCDLGLNPALQSRVEKLTPLNLLALGVRFGKLLSTTSRRYAQDIRTENLGHGLDRLLVSRESRLFGIMNGVRYDHWNPAGDAFLPVRYNDATGKLHAKSALQNELELPCAPGVPLLFFGGRLTRSYGCDLLLEALPDLADMPLQLVIYGTGDDEFMLKLEDLCEKWPNVRIRLGFDEAFLHRLVAGADMHLLPSREQPGGTNHLISLRYGAIPIARRTGGYVDAIHDQTERGKHRVNGFLFGSFYVNSLLQTVQEALDVYAERDLWCEYIESAMSADWSWKETAKAYKNLYRKLLPS